MELRHIRYFLAAAEELNLTKAAAKLCIAQPPMSRQIHDLEEELGAELFIRNKKGLTLTEAGKRFMQYAVQIDALAEQSVEDLGSMNKGLSGTLYLASVEGHAPHLISSWIAGFSRIYPDVQYDIWNGSTDDIADRVNSGLCDLALITEPYNREGFTGLEVYREPWIALMPAGHPLTAEPSGTVTPADLAPYKLIIPSRHSRTKEIEDWFAKSGVRPQIAGRISNFINAFELSEHGVGISIYPASAGHYTSIGSPGVVAKRLVNPAVEATYVLIYRTGRALPLVAKEFLDYVRESAKIDD